ncbi:hypothetical protein PINS_up021608 [Pythium insidiosum]|nr:hypothetical protein PINS_up021608 [Pythium insidiosum]
MRVPVDEAEATWRLYEEIAALDCFALDSTLASSESLSWRPLSELDAAPSSAPGASATVQRGDDEDDDAGDEAELLAILQRHGATVTTNDTPDDAVESTDQRLLSQLQFADAVQQPQLRRG